MSRKPYLKHQAIFDIQQDLPALPIIPNENVKSITVLHPSEETGVRCQRDNGISLDVKVPLEACRVHREQRIDEAEELHDALILAKILVPFRPQKNPCQYVQAQRGVSV